MRRTREHNGVALGMEQELKHVFTLNTTDMKAEGCEHGDVPSTVVTEEMLAYIENTLSFWGTSSSNAADAKQDAETKEAEIQMQLLRVKNQRRGQITMQATTTSQAI